MKTRIFFLLLLTTGCMRNEGLSTLSMAQENIWNLSRLKIGMKEEEVRSIMHAPYKTQVIEHEDVKYDIWFYVTRASALAQPRLVRQNVIPLTFQSGTLMGWGFETYDRVICNRSLIQGCYQSSGPKEKTVEPKKKSLEKTIEELESNPTALLIPNPGNNFIFEQRESCRQIVDRKWHSIKSIQCHLRSTIFDALTRSNMKLFPGFGITENIPYKKSDKSGEKLPPDDKNGEEDQPINEEDDESLKEADEQNFNFW